MPSPAWVSDRKWASSDRGRSATLTRAAGRPDS